MSTIAGRVAIVPKGNFSELTTYKRLDMVMYNGTLYIAKDDVPTGTLPTNTTYWMQTVSNTASIPTATSSTLGVVKPDNVTITIDSNGVLSADLSGKVDKVASATSGNFASLDSDGNLEDSGKSASDFEDAVNVVTGTGTVSVTVADNTDYNYTSVTSLTMVGSAVEAHGFITFGTSPSVTVSGFDHSDGDDITEATSSEVWEFSVYAHNSESYILWKNWSA